MAHSTTFRNVRHERFARALAVGKSQVAAYRDAGYAGKAAEQNASRIAKNPGVRARVAELLQEKADIDAKATARAVQELSITKADILRELAKIAFCDIRKAVRWGRSPVDKTSENADPNGLGIYPVELVPSELIDDDTAAAVAEVSLTAQGIKIKMHDKKAALVDIGKHLGMFIDRSEVGRPGDFETLSDAELDAAIEAELTTRKAAESAKNAGDVPPDVRR